MEVFTVSEVATYLKCSQSAIRKLVNNKQIPFYRIGRKILFKKLSIDAWILNQETEQTN